MSSCIILENFASPSLPHGMRHTTAELNAEYRRGYEEGRKLGQDTSLGRLAEALKQACDTASGHDDIRQAAIHNMLEQIKPILQAIAGKLSQDTSERLTTTILAELERLCLSGINSTCRISAGMDLIEQLTDQVAAMSLTGVTILPGTETEITFDGGRISIDPAEITNQITEILADMSSSKEQ
ncbi:MAG: hypothetical protein ACK5II_08370 [Paracoccus sp. (in: a-proteobacteria)]